MHSDTGCNNLRSQIFGLAERSEDLAPFAARGGAFLTGAAAAISIPVSVIAEAEAARALSREPEFATRSPEVTARAHAAVAARHVRNALSLRTRSVSRDVRWRWTLNVLWTAA